jgi:hypothetical protein
MTTGMVAAQPAPPSPPPPAPAGATQSEPEPPMASTAPAASQPAIAPSPAVVEPADPARPSGLAFGIGLGYLLPTSLQTPNATSVRVRLASGITLEPQLVFATTSDKVNTGATNKQTELTLASLVHYPLRVQRKVDLELLGSAVLSTRLINPNGDNNNRTITTLSLGYGLGIGYWITPHWNLSLSASNPLVAYTRTRQEMTADNTTVSSSTTLGLVFVPDVTLMIHLFD